MSQSNKHFQASPPLLCEFEHDDKPDTTLSAPPALDCRQLLVVQPGGNRVVQLVRRGALRIGRGETSDIKIDDNTVSRVHAILHVGAEIEIEDMGSANGTRVGGLCLEPNTRVPVRFEEPIRIGGVLLLIEDAAEIKQPWQVTSIQEFRSRLDAVHRHCAGRAGNDESFAVIHLQVNSAVPEHVIRPCLSRLLRARDTAGHAAGGGLNILLNGVTLEAVPALVDRLLEGLCARDPSARVGCAMYPRDATSPDELLQLARTNPVSARQVGRARLVVVDPVTRQLHGDVARIAATDAPVLLEGETGVGKEVFAERVHALSPRAKGPFVRVNCAALPDALIESELFGHERGAFTGATHKADGLVQAAAGGTLFLDEIGEMQINLQAKLLRLLESGELRRVGASRAVHVDLRFVAATNIDLAAAVRDGRFRADLYHRINVATVRVPPLRERRGDIGPLAQTFVYEYAGRYNRPTDSLSQAAVRLLESQPWPGNVRELRNVVSRAVIFCDTPVIGPLDLLRLDGSLRQSQSLPLNRSGRRDHLLGDTQNMASAITDAAVSGATAEKQRIVAALRECNGNQTAAANLLGMSRRNLIYKLDRYGLPRPRKRR